MFNTFLMQNALKNVLGVNQVFSEYADKGVNLALDFRAG